MNKKDVIDFFDRLAPAWDDMQVRNEEVIAEILFKGGIRDGVRVLDVACGTGVLFPDYKKLGADVTGIDISPEMVKIAKEKFPDAEVVCGDVLDFSFSEKFDAVMIYNAFPHFANRELLFENLSRYLKENGRITVAHGMSREALIKHHSGSAQKISTILPEPDELAEIMKPYFEVDTKISTDEIYIVSGKKQ